MLCSVNCPEALSEAYVTCGKCRRQFSTHVGSSGRSRFPETLTTFRFSCRACSQLANHARRRPVPHTGLSNEVVPTRWLPARYQSQTACRRNGRAKEVSSNSILHSLNVDLSANRCSKIRGRPVRCAIELPIARELSWSHLLLWRRGHRAPLRRPVARQAGKLPG